MQRPRPLISMLRLLALLFLWCGAHASTLAALQRGDWEKAYEKAVDQIEAALKDDAPPGAPVWSEAIGLLEEAIAVKPEPQTGRFGMLVARRKEYFPYFYLGLASLRSGLLDQSRAAFEKAREFEAVLQDRESSRELQRYESLLHYRMGADYLGQNKAEEALQSFEKADRLGGLPEDLKASLRDRMADATKRIDAVRMSFERRVEQAQSHLEEGRFGPALLAFMEAERLDPNEFQRRRLGQSRERARNGHVDRLLAEVREEQANGMSSAAQSKLKQALTVLPNRADVQETLRRIVGDYPSLKSDGDDAYRDSDWASALVNYQRAVIFFPSQADGDGLGPRLEAAARNLLLESVEQLMTGKVAESAATLEKAVAGGAADARIHAWLGVAYAKLAFGGAAPDRFLELRAKALEQFRMARGGDPQFRLPPRLVSPLILDLFNSVERK